MRLNRRVELLNYSSERLTKALELPKDRTWWGFMRRETWIHLKRTLQLLWAVIRKEVNGDAG